MQKISGSCILPSCPPGKALRAINPDGSAVCFSPLATNLSCTSGQFIQGIDVDGNLICSVAGGGTTGNTAGNTTGNPPSTCPAGDVTWGAGCTAQIAEGNEGDIVNRIPEPSGPQQGFATFKCNDRLWEVEGSFTCGTPCSPTLHWTDGASQGSGASSNTCTYTSYGYGSNNGVGTVIPGDRTGPFDDDISPNTGHAPHAICGEDGVLRIYNPNGQTPWTCNP